MNPRPRDEVRNFRSRDTAAVLWILEYLGFQTLKIFLNSLNFDNSRPGEEARKEFLKVLIDRIEPKIDRKCLSKSF